MYTADSENNSGKVKQQGSVHVLWEDRDGAS